MVKQKKLLLRCVDDSVIVMAFILEDGHEIKKEGTTEEIDLEISRASLGFDPARLPIIGWKEIEDESDLFNREFRNAWENKGGGRISHNMPKARAIHLDRIRAARDNALSKKDPEWMRAIGQNKKKDADDIEAERQILRDLPDTWGAAIEGAETVEELGAMWPDELEWQNQ